MKLHEVEFLRGSSSLCRFAVPGGWLYAVAERGPFTYGPDCHAMRVVDSSPKTFVPDPTAEHVTHATATTPEAVYRAEVYRDAVADCCEVIGEVARAWGLTGDQARGLMSALRDALRSPTSQTGEG